MPEETLNLEPSIPPFPEGVHMNPSQFAQWLVENMTFSVTGTFLSGQVGGARPGTNVGLYINGRMVELWDSAVSRYRSLLTVPIGTLLPFPSRSLSSPSDDYLLCQGQLLLKTDYPDLAIVLGDTWKAAGDDALHFRLPDTRGRIPVGSGAGDYNPAKVTGTQPGNITERTAGDYYGQEWPTYQQPAQVNAPAKRYYYKPSGGTKANSFSFSGKFYTGVTPPAFVVQWLIRAK